MSDARVDLALPKGAVVGSYRLREVHGEWGFYLIYLVEHTGNGQLFLLHELLPEELVLRAPDGKLVGKTEHCSESLAWGVERFVEEGRRLAGIGHLGIQAP